MTQNSQPQPEPISPEKVQALTAYLIAATAATTVGATLPYADTVGHPLSVYR